MPYIVLNQLYIFLLFFSFTAEGQQKLATNVQQEITTLSEALIEKSNIPGISIAVSMNGEILYAEGFGYANAEKNLKMDSSIRLRTASVAKVITATALGRLATEGKLDFDAPIKQYIPYIQPAYAELTSRQLAGHTAGLEHRPKGQSYKKKQYDNIEATVVLMNAPLLFEPDTDYKYSTHAFNLLAAVIESASGKKYLDYLYDDVFEPLKMNNTSAENIKKLTNKDAQVYYIKNDKFRKDKVTNASYKIPGAGFRSTPSDLVKMMNAYTNGFISEEVVKGMFDTHQLKNGTKTNVGIAWRSSIDPFDNKVIEHAGSWRGARTVIVHFPEENLNISLMINASCQILIEETAHMFAQIVRNNGKSATVNADINQDLTVTINSKEGKKDYTGALTYSKNLGHLKVNNDGFLQSNPIFYIGDEGNYTLVTAYGFLYLNLKKTNSIEGSIYTYYNRLNENPQSEDAFVTFRQ